MEINKSMKKKLLIVGTSHSQAVCRESGQRNKTFLHGRWFDLIAKEYNLEVTKLAVSGVTIEQQFEAVYNYHKTNPDIIFDYAIVEGRAIQYSMSTPDRRATHLKYMEDASDNDVNPASWENWTDQFIIDSDDNQKYSTFYNRVDVAYSYDVRDEYKEFFVNYMDSYLQAIQVWSSNIALMRLIDTFTAKSAWFSFSTSPDTTDPWHPFNEIGYTLMKDHLLFPREEKGHFPFIQVHEPDGIPKNGLDWDDYYCECGHYNLLGHRRLFNEIFKPHLEKIGFFNE